MTCQNETCCICVELTGYSSVFVPLALGYMWNSILTLTLWTTSMFPSAAFSGHRLWFDRPARFEKELILREMSGFETVIQCRVSVFDQGHSRERAVGEELLESRRWLSIDSCDTSFLTDDIRVIESR